MAPITQLGYPIYTVSEAALSRLQGDPEKYRRYYRKMVTLLSLVTMPLTALVFVQADAVVLLALGPEWTDAVPFFRVFAAVAFLAPAESTIGLVMVTSGLFRRYFVLGLASMSALVLVTVAAIPFGPIGIGAANIVALYLMLFPRLYLGLRGTPVSMRVFFAAIARPAVASLGMAAVLTLMENRGYVQEPLPGLLLAVVTGVVTYVGVLIALPGGRAEVRTLLADITESLNLPRALRPRA